jgi:hypothetical protein
MRFRAGLIVAFILGSGSAAEARTWHRATPASPSARRYEKALGPDHPDVAKILNTLAAFYVER